MRRARFGLLLVLAGAGATCGGGPQAGDIVFNLTTPNQDDGAVQFTVRAPTGTSLAAVAAACAGCQVFADSVSDTELRGVVVGSVTAGAVLRVTVSDRDAAGYTAAVVAVASRGFALRSGSGYTLAAATQ